MTKLLSGIIDKNFLVRRSGIIVPRVEGYIPTDLENAALDYLWLEWDYGFEINNETIP